MTIRLALFDVDGTLKHGSAWLPGALDLVRAVADAGVPVAVCSGRTAEALHLLADELGFVDLLAGNGGATVQVREGRGWRTIAQHHLDPDAVPGIVADLAAAGVEVWAYTPTRWLAAADTPNVAWEREATGTSPDIVDYATLTDIVKFVAVPASDADRAACLALADRYGVGVARSHPQLMDIAPLPALARKGADALVDHLGLAWDDVMAIGDSTNDVGMLSAVGLALVLPILTPDRLAPGAGERIAVADAVEALAVLRPRLRSRSGVGYDRGHRLPVGETRACNSSEARPEL